jgi:hypothetical protein
LAGSPSILSFHLGRKGHIRRQVNLPENLLGRDALLKTGRGKAEASGSAESFLDKVLRNGNQALHPGDWLPKPG